MSWLAFEYDATGELYWHATQKLPQAWNSCTQVTANQNSDCLYESGMSGDGTLFYPGRACAPTAANPACIGGPTGTDIPLESIRLKRLRDGREDYEYLHLLATSGDPADTGFARSTALGLFGPDLDHATFGTTVTPTAMAAARDALGDRIDASVPPPVPVVSIADLSVDEGDVGQQTGMLTLTRSGDLSETSMVDLTSAQGTATLGVTTSTPSRTA